MSENNSTKVKCPKSHKIAPQQRDPLVADKEETSIMGEKFERNYCRKCGEQLKEVNQGYRVVKLDKEMLPDIFKESRTATQVVKGLPKDAELADIGFDDRHLNLYFSSTEWDHTNLSEAVDEFEIEFKDHEVESDD